MSTPNKCPFCGSPKVTPAEFYVTDGNAAVPYVHFQQVKDFPWWKYAGGELKKWHIWIEAPTVCLGCGMLWAKYDLPRALELINLHGSAEFKSRVADPAGDDERTRRCQTARTPRRREIKAIRSVAEGGRGRPPVPA